MSEESGGDRGVTRRGFLKIMAGLAASATTIALGTSRAADIVKAGTNAIEQGQNRATEAQRRTIDMFNRTKDDKKVFSLTTGPDGAYLRSIPEPPNKATDPDKNNFVTQEWKPNSNYSLSHGAILVRGINPNNSGTAADWYFIVTESDAKTGKATGGYFSYAGNFTSAASSAVAITK